MRLVLASGSLSPCSPAGCVQGPGALAPEGLTAHSRPAESQGEGSLVATPVVGGHRPWPGRVFLPGMGLTSWVGGCGQGELSFEQDKLVAGGQLGELHNGTQYREVRQFCSGSGHHLVRFYFLTRVYSEYLEGVLEELTYGPAPDLVIINSCLWDLSRLGRGEREILVGGWRYGSEAIHLVLLPTLRAVRQVWPLLDGELPGEPGAGVCAHGPGVARFVPAGVEHGHALGGARYWGFPSARGK